VSRDLAGQTMIMLGGSRGVGLAIDLFVEPAPVDHPR
jgi:hypothetical protein